MKVLVTGVSGQLGHDILEELLSRGHEGVGSDLYITGVVLPYFGLDLTDESEVHRLMKEISPEAVIHCGALSGIENAEQRPAKAKNVNENGTRYLAESCKELGIKMLYVSTDFVFGDGGEWDEASSEFRPLNVYGETKLAGEKVVQGLLRDYFIVRLSWIYGHNGHNFVKTMLRQGKRLPEIEVPVDQIGIPTNTCDVARAIVDLIESDKYGVYHVMNSGDPVSLYEFAKTVFKFSGMSVKLKGVESRGNFGNTGVRVPVNSTLKATRLTENGFAPMRDWKEALRSFLWGYEGSGGGYAC